MDFTPAAGDGNGRSRLFAFSPRDILIVAALVFLASIAGGLSRPSGFLAVFWPANALLAGVLVRSGRLRAVPVLVGAAFGYLAAALVIGDSLRMGILLTSGNLVGALAFTLLFGALEPEDRALNRPQGVISLVLMACAASAAAGVIGGLASSEITATSYFEGWSAWFAAELVNYLALLPVILTLPPPSKWWPLPRLRREALLPMALPVLVTVLVIALSMLVPHPVSIVFPVPALIWCALTLPLSATAILVMVYSGAAMIGMKLGLFDLGLGAEVTGDSITIVHLGVALVALGPMVIASVNVERRRRIEQLERLARHDSLTDALTRSTFMEEGTSLISQLQLERAAVAVLVLDADHFKQINDLHGHPSGDRVLVAVAAAIRTAIRQGDLFGRIGGEEFALVLPRVSRREAQAVAERMRRAVANLAVVLESGSLQRITVSIGVAFDASSRSGLSEMVSLADRAMYEAKRAGRDQVVVCDSDGSERPPMQ
ncbi:sensor domain-containing diguanylate cyclase [Devosia sp.]|uniref:GGDEF domain-containing protein n=2 Tax=unclassified Devosia TaxID=196773 RepID=UPI000AFA7993|nr:sensor domain-containing diguanylate cyclase [Devosia sp.]MBN9361836.1 diguanylate cyclase [Devosia sp.]